MVGTWWDSLWQSWTTLKKVYKSAACLCVYLCVCLFFLLLLVKYAQVRRCIFQGLIVTQALG